MKAHTCFAVLLLVFPLLVLSAPSCQILPGNLLYTYKYQTSNSVIAAGIANVLPAVNTPSNAEDYLDENSCLGYLGPIGPYGPLSSVGPIGSNSWSTSYWITGSGASWSSYYSTINGPLTAAGPLGSTGPLSRAAYHETMPCINDFSAHLAAGGLWTVLGPLGPLGAAGALGPLGPLGPHGYTRDTNGNYRNAANTIVRSITVPWNATSSRTWELYERYTQAYASSTTFTTNDCSFMVQGIVGSQGTNGDTFKFKSAVSQFVTILLVPLKQLDEWTITVRDNNNNIIGTAGPGYFVNWMQIKVPANAQLKVSVSLYASYHWLASDYRLYVTGSTTLFQGTHITGPHLVSYVPL